MPRALVGPDGTGKTTLLRMLADDMQPSEGTVSTSVAVGVMRQFIGGPQANGGRSPCPSQPVA